MHERLREADGARKIFCILECSDQDHSLQRSSFCLNGKVRMGPLLGELSNLAHKQPKRIQEACNPPQHQVLVGLKGRTLVS